MAEWYVLAGLVAGNFAHQAGGAKRWDLALERSYFQVISILIFRLAQGPWPGP